VRERRTQVLLGKKGCFLNTDTLIFRKNELFADNSSQVFRCI
jgi:hypothetical protein